MSAVLRLSTPFVEKDLLVEALQSIDAFLKVDLNGGIQTKRNDDRGQQTFILTSQGHYIFQYDSDSDRYPFGLPKMPVQQFMQQVEKAYVSAQQKKLERLAEEERIRVEEERKARVDKVRREAIMKAKNQGYAVRETRKGDQIQLVLTRTVY